MEAIHKAAVSKTVISLLGWFGCVVGIGIVQQLCLPAEETVGLGGFTFRFFGAAVLFGLSLFGIGHLVLRRCFGSEESRVAIAVGMGVFALFLNIYFKFTLNPLAPLLLLFGGLVWALRLFSQQGPQLRSLVTEIDLPVVVGLVLVPLVTLSYNSSVGGFLYFPRDFDSNFFHVLFPKIVVGEGRYFNPDWLRGVWVPQLTHHLYIFVLAVGSDLYLKIINVVCFAQLAILFCAYPSLWARLLGSLGFSLLCAVPEFRGNIPSTNLDTVFALFTLSSFYLLRQLLASRKLSTYLLCAMLSGFSAGQKHFGLMFSVPVLAVASLIWIFPVNGAWSVSAVWGRSRSVVAAAVLFVLAFVPFYFHNVLEGNNLLFPFFGSQDNTYGWDSADLQQMLNHTIPHWGYSKSFLGYFMLPWHLLEHPDKYQFGLTGSPLDWVLSLEMVLLYGTLGLMLISAAARKSPLSMLAVVLCAQIFAWYKGSQVIRYLYPVLIAATLWLVWWLSTIRLGASSRLFRSFAAACCIVGGVSLAWLSVQTAQFPIPVTEEQRLAWIEKFQTPAIRAYSWLRGNVAKGERVLNLGSGQTMAVFPELVLCGDWFGRFRYDRFLNGYVQFKEWPSIQPLLVQYNFSYILVSWDNFAPYSSRPKSEEERIRAIPESTFRCLEHKFFDGHNTDVYQIRPECRLKLPEDI